VQDDDNKVSPSPVTSESTIIKNHFASQPPHYGVEPLPYHPQPLGFKTSSSPGPDFTVNGVREESNV
jgi:hypothetical protein